MSLPAGVVAARRPGGAGPRAGAGAPATRRLHPAAAVGLRAVSALVGVAAVAAPAAVVVTPALLVVAVAGAVAALLGALPRTGALRVLAQLVALLLGVVGAGLGRLSLPLAAVTGLLLLGHVLAGDLVRVVDSTAALARGAVGGWLRAVAGPGAGGVATGLAVLVAATLPVPPRAVVAVAAPLLVLAGFAIAVGGLAGRHREGRQRAGEHREGEPPGGGD